jgi:hypothetical protein
MRKKPTPAPAPAPLHFTAETLVRDVAAILTALLQGREACEGRLHFKIEPRRPLVFTLTVGDVEDSVHA